jgi:arabinose-5-phosphate isomerase
MSIKEAKKVLKIEAEGILQLANRLDDNFDALVKAVISSPGRLIVSGIGKSGIIGRKIAATLNSTGSRALFLHPVEAMHGDLGMVSKDDIFLALSNSGETDELAMLIPSIRSVGCRVIAFTGNKRSTLARLSDIVIDVGVAKEACPLGVAPTASTTALLAMGDALAVVLLGKRHFDLDDFKKVHPGGHIGQRLSSKVSDIMLKDQAIPNVAVDTPMKEVVAVMDRSGLGVTLVADDNNALKGIITDGDLRRLVVKDPDFLSHPAGAVMTPNPRSVGKDIPAYDALNIMEQHQITVLPITDSTHKILGILHLHDILGKGAFKFNGAAIA